MKTKINFCRKFFTKCSFYKIVSNYFNCELEPWRTVFAFRILELTSSINFIWNWTSSVTNSTKLLQTALGWLVTNCDSWFITNCDKFVPIWDNYYKLWQTNGTYIVLFVFHVNFDEILMSALALQFLYFQFLLILKVKVYVSHA